MDSTRQFTAAEQAYYSQLDEDVTTGRIGTVRRGTPRDGSRISDDELDAILRGRPGRGRAPAPRPRAGAGPSGGTRSSDVDEEQS